MNSSSNPINSANPLANNALTLLNAMSFYSPIIVCISILVFTMFTGTVDKSLFFFMWVFIITFVRIILFKGLNLQNNETLPEVCSTGMTDLFIPRDVTYSLYLLSFSLMYFVVPMILVSVQHKTNIMNYGILSFFVSYIVLDLFVKTTLSCVNLKSTVGDIMAGIGLGALIGGVAMYGTSLRRYLFINETGSNKEVCSMPSKQQFKCSVYQNGTLVGNI